ncbi:oligomeric golgi complex subunit [Wolffia australiana]
MSDLVSFSVEGSKLHRRGKRSGELAGKKVMASGGGASLAAGLSRKLRKVLNETRTDSPELLASLEALSSFYGENTLAARRGLKSTIENRALALNQEFLLASLPAEEALNRVTDEVNALAECCDLIAQALNSCNESTGDIISTTERLKQELDVTVQRQEIASCFLRDYQLSIEEISALRDEELNENFFKVLSHVQEIHANCKILLRTHHQRAGLELMDMMAMYQEGAYERLCRWVHTECKKLGDSDNPEVSELLKTASRCLRERPVLFKYCAEEVANMRHHALFRRFLSALTRGGPGGVPRPIEVHAHDPLRYVGDMLGWLHQALASERELIHTLLDPDAVTDGRITTPHLSKKSEGDLTKFEPDTTAVLDRIFEGASRPFKVRVEQVLQSQPSLIVAYKLSNTLEFYNYTVSDFLGEEASLCNTLRLLKDAAQQTFFNILRNRGDKLLKYPIRIAVDLSPPPAVREGVSLMLEIIDTYSSMMFPALAKRPDFHPVISSLLDPIVLMCEKAAESHESKGATYFSKKNPSSYNQNNRESSPVDALLSRTSLTTSQGNTGSSKIFLINCLSAIQQPLSGHEVAANYVKTLGSKIEAQVNALVEGEVHAILGRCGLLGKMPVLEKSTKNQARPIGEDADEPPLAEIQETSPPFMAESLRSFFGIISGTEGSLPEFELMQMPSLRSSACAQVSRALADLYDLMYCAVVDPQNKYPDPKSLVRHNPDQVRTILGI